MTDPGDGPLEQIPRALRACGLAEAQRVEDRDRSRADGEDVTQDPADAGGSALERLDRARVIVGLDLERDPQPAADIDDAGVLAGSHQHRGPIGRQPSQELLGVLVGAVLGPHQRQHRQLGVARRTIQQRDDQRVLVVGQPECAVAFVGDAHYAATPARSSTSVRIDSNRHSPSTEPVSASTACSGCGISPNTLRCSLQTPAMSRSEPFGLWPGA